jgi:hypothetical protein
MELTQLMRLGGVPPREMFDLEIDLYDPSRYVNNSGEEFPIISEFLRVYFGCGFVYGKHLDPIIKRMNRNDFQLYFDIYQHIYTRNNPQEIFEKLFVDSWTIEKNRMDILVDWIEFQKISLKNFGDYIQFDFEHFKMDMEAIFIVMRNGLQRDPEIYLSYIQEILSRPLSCTDSTLNFYLRQFFYEWVHLAVYSESQSDQQSQNEFNHREMIEKLEHYSRYMIDSFCKILKYIENLPYNLNNKEDKIRWLEERISYIVTHRPMDLCFAYLLKKSPQMLKKSPQMLPHINK